MACLLGIQNEIHTSSVFRHTSCKLNAHQRGGIFGKLKKVLLIEKKYVKSVYNLYCSPRYIKISMGISEIIAFVAF